MLLKCQGCSKSFEFKDEFPKTGQLYNGGDSRFEGLRVCQCPNCERLIDEHGRRLVFCPRCSQRGVFHMIHEDEGMEVTEDELLLVGRKTGKS